MLSIAGGALVVVVLVISQGRNLARGGLRPCARLDERLCRDLGPARCAVWRERIGGTGAASTQPHRWRGNRTVIMDIAVHKLLGWDAARADNPSCYDQLADDIYPIVLRGIRAMVDAVPSKN